MARLFSYNLTTEEEQELALFMLDPGLEGALLSQPQSFLWDVSPSGKWVALNLCTPVFLSPRVSNCFPSLYLIDLEENTGTNLGLVAVAPAFSPDEKFLAFATAMPIDKELTLVLYDLETEECQRLPQTGASFASFFWLGSKTLGLAVEFEETPDPDQLMTYDLETGSLTPLIKDVE